MSAYGNGANLERRAMKRLEEGGFYVMRSAGSHGIADLIALHSTVRLFVQCKRDISVMGTTTWNALLSAATALDCQACVVDMSGARQTAVLWHVTGSRDPYQRPPWAYELGWWDVVDWQWVLV